MNIAEKFSYLNDTKIAIKEAIIAKGVAIEPNYSFRSLAAKIAGIATATTSMEDINYPEDAPDIVAMLNDPWFSGKDSNKYVILFMGGNALVPSALHRDSTRFSYSLSYSDDLSTVYAESDTNFIPVAHTWADSNAYHWIFMTMTRSVKAFVYPFFCGVRNAWANWIPLVSETNSRFISPKTTIPGMEFTSLFYRARYLRSLMIIDTSAAISTYNMFYQCSALATFPLLDTSACLSMNNMFVECISLRSFARVDTSNCTNFATFLSGCYALPSLPALNTSAGSNFSDMFKDCFSLSVLNFNDPDETIDPNSWSFKESVSFGSSPLNRDSILGVFKRLQGTGKTISISYYTNKLLSDPDRTIATGKGWTVSVSTTY